VKAGVIGLMHFLPFQVAWPEWGQALVIVGMVSAFYGVFAGMVQAHPKSILGCSSISQMGVITAILGMGLASGKQGIALLVACYAVNHTLVKGGLFIAIGVAQTSGGQRLRGVLLPAAVLSLGLGGLPLTGGWLAKLAVKPVLGSGTVGLLASLSAAGTTLLMIHFVARLSAVALVDRSASVQATSRWAWFSIALASIATPWLMVATQMPTLFADAVSPGSLLEVSWPILLGGVLAAALWPWRDRLTGSAGTHDTLLTVAYATVRRASDVGAALEKLDLLLRQWPIAVILLLNLAALLTALLLAAG
jgi:formate hydrogenlyase subunit 3/multisubunit Na+/H+ antiporter MnhD subunit